MRQFIRSAIRDWAVCRIGALCPSSRPATTTRRPRTRAPPRPGCTSRTAPRTRSRCRGSGRSRATRTRDHDEDREADGRAPARGDQEVDPDLPHAGRRRAPAAMAVRSATSAVASLNSDSPSRIVTIRRGRPIRRADRGGGDRVRWRDDGADRQRRPPVDARQQRVHEDADPGVVKTTRPKLSSRIGRRFALKSTRDVGSRRRTAAGEQAEQHDVGGEVDGRHAGTKDATTPTTISAAVPGRRVGPPAPSRRAPRSPERPARKRSPRGHSTCPAKRRVTPGPRPTSWGLPSRARRAEPRQGQHDEGPAVRRERQHVGDHPAVGEDLARLAQRVDEGVVEALLPSPPPARGARYVGPRRRAARRIDVSDSCSSTDQS